jgi:hypothetical protein
MDVSNQSLERTPYGRLLNDFGLLDADQSNRDLEKLVAA